MLSQSLNVESNVVKFQALLTLEAEESTRLQIIKFWKAHPYLYGHYFGDTVCASAIELFFVFNKIILLAPELTEIFWNNSYKLRCYIQGGVIPDEQRLDESQRAEFLERHKNHFLYESFMGVERAYKATTTVVFNPVVDSTHSAHQEINTPKTMLTEKQWLRLKVGFQSQLATANKESTLVLMRLMKNPALRDYYSGNVLQLRKGVAQATLEEVIFLFAKSISLGMEEIWSLLWQRNTSLRAYLQGLILPDKIEINTRFGYRYLLGLFLNIAQASQTFFQSIISDLNNQTLLEGILTYFNSSAATDYPNFSQDKAFVHLRLETVKILQGRQDDGQIVETLLGKKRSREEMTAAISLPVPDVTLVEPPAKRQCLGCNTTARILASLPPVPSIPVLNPPASVQRPYIIRPATPTTSVQRPYIIRPAKPIEKAPLFSSDELTMLDTPFNPDEFADLFDVAEPAQDRPTII